MQGVAIIQRQIPHYRNAFFAKLSAQAKDAGLDMPVQSPLLSDD